ncbi:hypothetical protein [Sporolactobacillus pectinivorans]|uniref:hypothetical protein n=1 Tax=Sporolactobacillus pectinivorans TaxID=1591408 RepID=UPI00138FE75D|nr:hypothetical protein [Sporolactobacillus pectinivorans]
MDFHPVGAHQLKNGNKYVLFSEYAEWMFLPVASINESSFEIQSNFVENVTIGFYNRLLVQLFD